MVMRPHQWFFAIVLSLLIHAGVIYNLTLFEYAPIERKSKPLPFTVMLADTELLNQFVLEDPESVSSDPIPLVSLEEVVEPEMEQTEGEVDIPQVSLDEIAEPEIEQAELGSEISPPADLLDLLGGQDDTLLATTTVDAPELELTQIPTVDSVPPSAVVSIAPKSEESVKPPVGGKDLGLPGVPDLPVLSPEQIPGVAYEAPLAQEMHAPQLLPEEEVDVGEPESQADSPYLIPEPEDMPSEAPVLPGLEAEETLLPEGSELPQQHEVDLPEVSDQSATILAEITVEQIEFTMREMEMLPEVTAQDWLPGSGGIGTDQAQGWKRRYAGASGISGAYRRKMRTTLTQFTLYPKAVAEEQKIEGKVVIGFMIDRQGYLVETEILESSGHSTLDKAVEKMIEFAQPFDKLPATVINDRVRFAFPVTIKLKR